MRSTPIRAALQKRSTLTAHIYTGIKALKKSHRTTVDVSVRAAVADSVDLDEALRATHPNEPRWDYLLGLGRTRHLVAIEPHSAHSDQVSLVIAKKKHALAQLAKHFSSGARVSGWYWIASGATQFIALEKERLRLDQHGITFVGRTLTGKHLRSNGISV